MDFAKINACHFVALWLYGTCLLLVGRNGFILTACPMDNYRLGEFPRPIEYERDIALPIGQSEHAVLEQHGRAFVLDAEIPFALPGWFGSRVCLASFPP